MAKKLTPEEEAAKAHKAQVKANQAAGVNKNAGGNTAYVHQNKNEGKKPSWAYEQDNSHAVSHPGGKPVSPGPNPNEPGSRFENSPEGWAAYKEVAKAWRAWASQNQAWQNEQMSYGATPEDLGMGKAGL